MSNFSRILHAFVKTFRKLVSISHPMQATAANLFPQFRTVRHNLATISAAFLPKK